jgi:hypothetical protein
LILQDDDKVFNIVVHPNQTQNVNVVMQKIQSQKVTIITNIKFGDIDIKAYPRLPDDEKREFIMNREILLIQINLIYNIFPNPPKEVHGVEMSKHIYFDG